MTESNKKFDAVAMMRSIREKLAIEIEDMALEEELAWLESREIEDRFLRGLRDRAARRDDAAASATRGS